MESLSKTMQHVLQTCDIELYGKVVSKELLVKTFGDFLAQTIEKKNHNVGMIMHTGSICFDVVAVTFAAITNLVSNNTNVDDTINSFVSGDIVLYGTKKKERYEYVGIIDGSEIGQAKGKKYVKLIQNNSATYVSDNGWGSIVPYNGDSSRLDGRGIRRKATLRNDFYVDVLEYRQSDIPGVIDTSSVIVIDKERAEYLAKGISISFGNKKVKFLDLVTASYFTEEDEYRYGGNTGKNEPIIKFTSKVSVARTLLLSKKGNIQLGLIVLGKDCLTRGMTELPELLNRKSLKYVYLCSSMDFEYGTNFLEENEEMEVFACTKDFLLEHTTPDITIENEYTNELAKQVGTLIDKEISMNVLDKSPIVLEEYIEFKKNLLMLKRTEFDSVEKDNFIIHAHSLMNLFITAAFPLSWMKVAKQKELLDIDLPEQKIENLEKWSAVFSGGMLEASNGILACLKKAYGDLYNSTEKYDWLASFLNDNYEKKIAIVVPKAYYIPILKASGLFSVIKLRNVSFYSVGRFDASKIYDYVIALGDYEGKGFSVFKCNASVNIVSVLYDLETRSYKYKKRAASNVVRLYQKRSTIIIESKETDEPEVMEESINELEEVEISEYIKSLDETNTYRYSRQYASVGGSVNTDIVAIASFSDDSKAFFSKRYKGYVLDDITGEVREEEATKFCEGDSIVFTQNNSDTKDIVSSILNQLIEEKKLDEKSIKNCENANRWKNSLIHYMNDNEYTAREVASLMVRNGASVQEPTILYWLYEDSHTVGPRNMESIRQIGQLTGDVVLRDNPNEIFEACREVRVIRRRILDQIGKAVVNKLSGKPPKQGSEFSAIYEKVDSLAVVMQIERIAFVNTEMPISMANRPISI